MQVLQAAERWGQGVTAESAAEKLAAYGNLLLQWNARLNLTAIRDGAELIERHLMEGVFAAAHHPIAANALDFGSGTGIPGIPIALCRGNIRITLAESQRKKASFLQEAVRQLNLDATVHAGRAEALPSGSFDAVWMRAVDKSAAMLSLAAALVAPGGALCLLTTRDAAQKLQLLIARDWQWTSLPFPGANARVLHIGSQI